jgi:GAF domain-containing protein
MSGQSIVTSEVAKDARFARDIAESTNYIPETILAAPLIDDDGEVVGVLEVLDPQTRGSHAGHDLDTLGVVATQLASIIRLSETYDALGESLLTGLANSSSVADFGAAIADVSAAAQGRTELVALAKAFHQLATTGPQGAELAAGIIGDVAAYTRTRR